MTDPLYREPVKTVVTEVDIIHAVKQAYHAHFGSDITLDTLAILCAQIFLECGRGKECWNFNLGNVKRRKGHAWTMYQCGELINGKYEKFYPPHFQTHFSAYSSLPDAAQEHLAFLNRDRYKAALEQANCGDPMAYCEELHKAGYYTATVARYSKTLIAIYEEIRTKYATEATDDPYC